LKRRKLKKLSLKKLNQNLMWKWQVRLGLHYTRLLFIPNCKTHAWLISTCVMYHVSTVCTRQKLFSIYTWKPTQNACRPTVCCSCTSTNIDETVESKLADTKVEECDNQMTVVDDVGNSPSGSPSRQRSSSRSRSRSSYSSNKSGKVMICIYDFLNKQRVLLRMWWLTVCRLIKRKMAFGVFYCGSSKHFGGVICTYISEWIAVSVLIKISNDLNFFVCAV
jgi:hypothetical protein